MSGNRDSANAAETGTERFALSKETGATNKGVSEASAPTRHPGGTQLLRPPSPSRHPLHPCMSPLAQIRERTDATFAIPGRWAEGTRNWLQFPQISKKEEREERAQAKRESTGESCHGGFLTLAGLGDHSLPREEDHLSWEERVPFHGRPLWPLAPSRRALPNSQAVCCLSSLQSPWKKIIKPQRRGISPDGDCAT